MHIGSTKMQNANAHIRANFLIAAIEALPNEQNTEGSS